MKIGPSTIGAVVFTAVSVAAFGWMTQRPKASGQAVGFAMPSSGGVSSSTNSATSTDAPQAVADTTSNSSDAESTTATEKTTTEAVEEKKEVSSASASIDEATSAPETQASTESAVEETSTAEPSSESAVNAEPQDSSTTPLTTAAMAQGAEAVTTTVLQSGAVSEEANTAESVNSATTEPSSSVSSNATDPATNESNTSSTEQPPLEATPAQAEQSSTSEPTTEAGGSNASTAIQAVQLKSANGTSAGIYTAAENANGTVVILHGCDYKPEGEDNVVRPLHEGLPQEGWNTLSLQLPNLSASSSYKDLEAIMPDAAARIESGISMAKGKSQTPVVLFAHGCGAQVALAWMEVKGSDSISGYIGLGAGVMNASADDASHLRLPLEKMKFPQLDIYGSTDNEAVLKTAPERLSHINRAANPASRQKRIEGADHNITGKGKELSDVVVKWLNGLAFKK